VYSELDFILDINNESVAQLACLSQRLLEDDPGCDAPLIVNMFAACLGFSFLESIEAKGVCLVDRHGEQHIYLPQLEQPLLFSPMEVTRKWLFEKITPTDKHISDAIYEVKGSELQEYWCDCAACTKSDDEMLMYCDGGRARPFEEIKYELN